MLDWVQAQGTQRILHLVLDSTHPHRSVTWQAHSGTFRHKKHWGVIQEPWGETRLEENSKSKPKPRTYAPLKQKMSWESGKRQRSWETVQIDATERVHGFLEYQFKWLYCRSCSLICHLSVKTETPESFIERRKICKHIQIQCTALWGIEQEAVQRRDTAVVMSLLWINRVLNICHWDVS